MSVLIGHAGGDENGGAHGGQTGDQTGREVYILNWYSGGWNIVLRPKNAAVAEKMANACEVLCKSNLVGYDQWERNTLWDELEKVGWNPSALKTKCETDCSAFMTACARVAGINVPRVALGGGKYNAPITSTMRQAFGSTGAFDVLTDSKYCTSDRYLKRGDVLVRESGHTAMSLGNGDLAGFAQTSIPATAQPAAPAASQPAATTATRELKATEPAHYFDKTVAGRYRCTASALNIRNGAGVTKKILTTIKKGTIVQCYGYLNTVDEDKWLYIQFQQGTVKYTAFASAKYLEKI